MQFRSYLRYLEWNIARNIQQFPMYRLRNKPNKKERFPKSKKPQLKPFHVIPPFMSKPPTPANSIDPRTTSWPIPGGHVPKKAQATTLCSTNRNCSRLCPGPFLFAPPKEKKNFVPFGMAEWERNKILQHPCPSFVKGQWDPRGNRSPGCCL